MVLPRQTRRLLRWCQYLFLISGTAALGYVGFALADAQIFQASQTLRFRQALSSLRSQPDEHVPAPAISAVPAKLESLQDSGMFPLGRLEISSIGLAAMILEGTDEPTLRRAVGHIPGTSLPGQKGNVAIAGHRDTFFRALRNVHLKDEITVTTLKGLYRYRVESATVVEPDDGRVLDEPDDAVLTLVTCYPFYFVGSAPQRFVVRARRISE